MFGPSRFARVTATACAETQAGEDERGQRTTKGTVLTSQSWSPWCDCRRLGSTWASWRWQDINVGNPLWRRTPIDMKTNRGVTNTDWFTVLMEKIAVSHSSLERMWSEGVVVVVQTTVQRSHCSVACHRHRTSKPRFHTGVPRGPFLPAPLPCPNRKWIVNFSLVLIY